jgi:hypothetical protein
MAFMFTMYISASASLRQLAAFYDSDLKTKVLQVSRFACACVFMRRGGQALLHAQASDRGGFV